MRWRVEWRCATEEIEELCVAVTPGISEMQWLSAASLVSTLRVREQVVHHSIV